MGTQFNKVLEPKSRFEKAIEKGFLSLIEGSENHAGNYMYMLSQQGTAGVVDSFKHMITRKYVKVEYPGENLPGENF
tara:strand:- start:656 stop:886 length:231 start_codon:yes stop_codon:yes gene_type:complete